ncbi:protein-tyrosine-phosphatase [Mycobacteroides abscessus subsp. abscessus]|nr:protein-tyrosine-phosphatase [Mycobacteroides abscessus subsp. abscessus]
MHLLFVCTGNICRSPTAERLTTAWAADHNLFQLAASSAGIAALIGEPIHPAAARVLQELGGSTANFAARQFSSRIAAAADLILTMTKAHQAAVLEAAPNRLRRTFTLSEVAFLASTHRPSSIADLADLRPQLAAHEQPDIPDPIGQTPEYFAEVGSQIVRLLPPILELCRRSIDKLD